MDIELVIYPKTTTETVSKETVSKETVSTVPNVSLCDDHAFSQECVDSLSHLRNLPSSRIPFYLMNEILNIGEPEEEEQSSVDFVPVDF